MAENDSALLPACDVGIAVGHGSQALSKSADQVVEDDAPAAVSSYLRGLCRGTGVPAGRLDRHRMLLGALPTRRPVSLAMRGRNVLVTGYPRPVSRGCQARRASS